MEFNEGTVYSGRFFWVRYIVKHVVEVGNSGTPCFLCRSLL